MGNKVFSCTYYLCIVIGLLKFFGNIGQKYPEIFSSYPNILQAIFQAVDSDDLPVSVTALETIGFLAASTTGKELLAKQGNHSFIFDLFLFEIFIFI
jgi:hypothetical protein